MYENNNNMVMPYFEFIFLYNNTENYKYNLKYNIMTS